MTGRAAHPAGRRRRVRVFVLLGILMLLVAYVGLDLWSGRRLDVELSRLQQSYGSLDDVGVEPVPAVDNRARVVVAAAALTAFSSGTTETDFRTAFSRFNLSPAREAVPSELQAFVETNREAIRLAGEARSRGRSSFEVDYPFATRQAPLLDMRTLSSAIYLAALMDLDARRADAAAATITSGLVASASLRQEPQLIAQLIRIAVAMQQFDAVQRLVTESEPSGAALEDLARWLVEARTPDPIRTGLLGELKHFHAAFVTMGTRGATGSTGDRSIWYAPFARMGRPAVRLAHQRYLRRMAAMLDVQAGPRPRPGFPALPEPSRWEIGPFVTASTRGLERTIVTGDDFNSQLGATEVAVALRRFRLSHSDYPADLSALTPAYLDRLPIDPFTGQAPVYARKGAGFTLRAQGSESLPAHSKRVLEWAVAR